MKRTALLAGLLILIAQPAHAQRPICIVNGVRITNGGGTDVGPKLNVSEVDQSSIQSIEVIKGAAAVRQYGQDAINGVISITTKKGASTIQNWASVCQGPSRPDVDPFSKFLFPPDFVMAHQDAIHLTERQRGAVQDAVIEVQGKATAAQFKLAAVSEKLSTALAALNVDEASVLQLIDQVLAAERDVKRAQISLLIRVKNQLTPEQQAALDKLR